MKQFKIPYREDFYYFGRYLEDKLGQGTSFPTESLNIKVNPTFLFSLCSGLEFTK